jgi:hypothetical protein
MRLRLIVGLGALLCIAAAATPCGAQPAVLLPSDVELASAYCIGVLQRQAAMADERALKSPGADGYATQQIEQHRQELRETLERLQSYLVPRMPYLDAMALAGAGARADADIDDVLAQGRRASTDCRRTDTDEALQCTLAKVQASRSWHRMDHCTHIDFLPF